MFIYDSMSLRMQTREADLWLESTSRNPDNSVVHLYCKEKLPSALQSIRQPHPAPCGLASLATSYLVCTHAVKLHALGYLYQVVHLLLNVINIIYISLIQIILSVEFVHQLDYDYEILTMVVLIHYTSIEGGARRPHTWHLHHQGLVKDIYLYTIFSVCNI